MIDPIRVLVLTPSYLPAIGGNATSVRRLQAGFPKRGISVEIEDLSRSASEARSGTVRTFRPTILHAYHATKSGVVARELAAEQDIPFVVTCTGTDINHDLDDLDRRLEVCGVLRAAAAVIVYTRDLAGRILSQLPELEGRVHVIPKGIALGNAPCTFRRTLDLAARDFIYLLPGGLRKVKGPDFCLEAMEALAREYSDIRLVVAGPVLDSMFSDPILQRIARLPWARYAGTLPHEVMGTVYGDVDVVLNTSMSEGLANVILEAMSAAKPVLAAGIPGNRALIEPGVTGLLYEPGSTGDFQRQARRLHDDPEMRRRLGSAGREHVLRTHSAEAELEAIMAIYRRCLGPGHRT